MLVDRDIPFRPDGVSVLASLFSFPSRHIPQVGLLKSLPYFQPAMSSTVFYSIRHRRLHRTTNFGFTDLLAIRTTQVGSLLPSNREKTTKVNIIFAKYWQPFNHPAHTIQTKSRPQKWRQTPISVLGQS